MNYPRHVIGNQGGRLPAQQHRQTTYLPPAQTRSFTPDAGFNAGGFGGAGGAGGAGNPFSGYPGLGEMQYPALQSMTPQQTAGGGMLGSLFGGGGGAAAGAGSGFNIGQLKTIVDRLGGIEGIVSTFGKVQQVVQTMSQMAPMLKLLLGSFGKKAAASDTDAPVRRRRRNRRKVSARVRRRPKK
ncbi:hypothetical protein O9H85_28525 [Paenibacillus filicis]|uniref:Tyrosine protein kinase n=1 Tax=Paenibacillus gyeongsangnamensis TaxID=3388067 RepID=A0ABT4QH90_9BACL|nr:hypothetical protein [Paenibacillus filicis]MCZ8516270.1 hypothetical protein [Paenibacillus filicis]